MEYLKDGEVWSWTENVDERFEFESALAEGRLLSGYERAAIQAKELTAQGVSCYAVVLSEPRLENQIPDTPLALSPPKVKERVHAHTPHAKRPHSRTSVEEFQAIMERNHLD